MKPIDELTRNVEAKCGATWGYVSNCVDADAILEPGFFSARFPDRNMRPGDKVEVVLFDGKRVTEIATLVVTEIVGRGVVTVKRAWGFIL